MSLFASRINAWSRKALLALLIATIAMPGASFIAGTQVSAGPAGALKVLCAPETSLSELKSLLRSHIRVPDSSARYDDIVSGVLWRVTKACLSGDIPEDVSDQEARLNTWVRNSRVDAYRRNRIYDFGAELDQLIPPTSEATDANVLDVVHKKATTRQRIVFDLLAQGLTQEEVAERIGKSTATVNNEKQAVEALLKQEFVVPRAGNKRTEVKRPEAASPRVPAPVRTTDEPSMVRVKSPIGQEVLDALKKGAEVTPTGGGYAGPVMTVKIPNSRLSAGPVNGIAMLPAPVVLRSDAAGEQEMIATAVREIGDDSNGVRTFGLSHCGNPCRNECAIGALPSGFPATGPGTTKR